MIRKKINFHSLGSAEATLGRVVVSQLARIPSAIMEETFEELYLDPLIENFIKTRFDILGLIIFPITFRIIFSKSKIDKLG